MKSRIPLFRPSAVACGVRAAFVGGALCLGGLAAAQAPAAPAATGAAFRAYRIPPGPLDEALTRFARQAGITLSFTPAQVSGLRTRGIDGSYSLEAGLAALLAGTGQAARPLPQGNWVLHGMPLAPAGTAAASAPPATAARAADGGALPTTTVRAARDPHDKVFETPASVNIISREEIERSSARHASEILQATPGVSTVTNEQVPSVSVNIRGLKDFGRVNMNIDGMRQNYQRSGHQQRNGEMFFDTEMLSEVEITKGPTSGVGGAGVLAGVATFRTLDFGDLLAKDRASGGRARLTAGTNHHGASGSLAGAWRLGEDAEGLLAVSGRKMGAYEAGQRGRAFDFGNSTMPVGIVSLTDQDIDSGLAKLRWRPAPGHELLATVLRTNARFAESSTIDADLAYNYQVTCQNGTVPGPFCADVASRYSQGTFYPRASQSSVRATNAALDYRFRTGHDLFDLRAKLYHAETANHTTGTTGGVPYLSVTNTETLGASLENTSLARLGAFDVEWKQGVEYFRDEVRPSAESTGLTGGQLGRLTGGTPRGNRWLASAFTNAMFAYGDVLQVDAGVRRDWYHLWGNTGFDAIDAGAGNIPLPAYGDIRVNRRDSAVSPTLGTAIAVTPQLQFFANAAKGWRPPAVTETLISGSHPNDASIGYYPNYLLASERARHTEIGVNLKFAGVASAGDRLRVKVAGFRTRVENYIYFTGMLGVPGMMVPGLGRTMFVNSLDPVNFHGTELEVRYDAPRWWGTLAYTNMQRTGSLARRVFPLGGATGPDAEIMNAQVDSLNGGMYNPLPPRERISVDAGARFLERRLTLGTRLTCASRSGAPATLNSFSNAQNGFCVVDLHGRYAFTSTLSLSVALKNAADRQYAQAMGDAYVRSYAPGRTLLATVQLDF